MLADQPRLRRRLRGLRRTRGDTLDRAAAEIRRDAEDSAARRERRRLSVPAVRHPSDLPVSARRDEIAGAIAAHQVVVICGETGSGKSTQLPKICLSLGRGVGAMIGHTQPRRLAARSIAARLADELGLALGRGVGAKVRFSDATGPDTLIKVMTDGVLLAETQRDPVLSQYDSLIIDEAHERSLNIDFLLGYLHGLLPRRPDLKLIITSATIDPGRFSRHFGGAPVIEVSGRTYPVEVRHRPLPEDRGEKDDDLLIEGLLGAVDELAREGPGDVLVFLPGEREIREAAEALRKHHPRGTEILPLYAKLSNDEQQRVFSPSRGRRVVLATNVAETSLTVPGIRSVVDSGLARISRVNPRTKVQRLAIEPVSQASARQRAGRCGRVGPGICIRLYAEDDFASRPAFTEPEILRSNLAGVILQMKALGLGRVETFPFIEPPEGRQVREGYRTLHELGAVDEAGEITDLGRRLARFPIDPRLARMVVAGAELGALDDVLVIAAGLAVPDPRDRPLDKQDRADEAHAPFKHPESDFLGLLALWNAYHDAEKRLSHSRARAWARDRFLSYLRLREWHDVHRQLREMASAQGLRLAAHGFDPDLIHRALLTGLLSNVGRKAENAEYQGPHGIRFFIHPGSGLFEERPAWIMAAELVQTTRLYARTVAKVKPEWVEAAAGHLVKRTYYEPFWEARRGRVNAFERISLHGLEIMAGREVHYGPIEPAVCHEMFIQKALVDGDYRTGAPWARHNRRLVQEVEMLEERLRRRDLLAAPEHRFAFYDARVPAEIYTGAAFELWRRSAERADPQLLFMRHEDLMNQGPTAEALSRFPASVEIDGADLPVRYRFSPGESDDGATVTVPVEVLARMDPSRADWMIPGLVREKVLALVRALPKSHRRLIGPAPEFADAFLAANPSRAKPLTDAINDHLRTTTGVIIEPDVWARSAPPEFLRLRYRVVDDAGRELAHGRDLSSLRREVAGQLGGEAGAIASEHYTRDALTEWDIPDLPERLTITRRGATFDVFPALLDRGASASLRVLDNASDAAREHERGVLRLFILESRRELELALRGAHEVESLKLLFATLGSPDDLARDLTRLIAERAFLAQGPAPRTGADFARRLRGGQDRIPDARRDVLDLVSSILDAQQRVALDLSRTFPPAFEPSIRDMRAQLARLVRPGFLSATPGPWLRHLPRFLSAIALRLRKLAEGGLDRDRRHLADLAPHLAALGAAEELTRGHRFPDPETEHYRWMTEECRVWMFAQELRTSIPISLKRLDDQRARLPRPAPA
ncbi:MAG: ATP-dependent RNA helicase HrpA [Phycisphaerales bacterium]|nr:ATP-dependent RNA helicase HrpA [Phycisphaerales bacterium]